jgi:uncharacterized damage-inducible protein DinB
MMDARTCLAMWDLLRQRHGIGLRTVALIPETQLDSHPIRDMRTPAELVTHTYTLFKELPEGVLRGEIRDYGEGHVKVATVAELVRFCETCYAAGEAATRQVTDAQLAAQVKTPWGMSFPGWMCYGILNDEYLHHRGQLYTYVRQLGAAPPMMWDFAGNAAAYQPRTPQTA